MPSSFRPTPWSSASRPRSGQELSTVDADWPLVMTLLRLRQPVFDRPSVTSTTFLRAEAGAPCSCCPAAASAAMTSVPGACGVAVMAEFTVLVRQSWALCCSAEVSALSPVGSGSAAPASFQSTVADEPSKVPNDTSLVPAMPNALSSALTATAVGSPGREACWPARGQNDPVMSTSTTVSDVSGGCCPVSCAVSQEQEDCGFSGPTGVVVHDAHESAIAAAAMAPPARVMRLDIGVTAGRSVLGGNRHTQVHQQAMKRGLALEGELDRLNAIIDGECAQIRE